MRVHGSRQVTVRLLLAANIAVGLLGESLHHEWIAVRRSADTAVAPHDCGAQERHIPLDNLHPCALCISYSHRVFTSAPQGASATPLRIVLCALAAERFATLSTDRPYRATRGPPAA